MLNTARTPSSHTPTGPARIEDDEGAEGVDQAGKAEKQLTSITFLNSIAAMSRMLAIARERDQYAAPSRSGQDKEGRSTASATTPMSVDCHMVAQASAIAAIPSAKQHTPMSRTSDASVMPGTKNAMVRAHRHDAAQQQDPPVLRDGVSQSPIKLSSSHAS